MILITEAVAVAKIASKREYFYHFPDTDLDHKLYKVNYASYIPLFDQESMNNKENR